MCIHEEVCDLWRTAESQSAACYAYDRNDNCTLFIPKNIGAKLATIFEIGARMDWPISEVYKTISHICDTEQIMYMSSADEVEILKQALDTYGAEAQTLMMFEEMAELQKELCKHARGRDNRDHIAEEIADVLIMLEQMMLLHDCKDAVAECRRRKIERLAERLKEANHEKDIT